MFVRDLLRRSLFGLISLSVVVALDVPAARAQQVGLPTPRLLTTLPMGGQSGTTFEVTVTGENIDDDDAELLFSSPGITSVHQVTTDGQPVKDKFLVTVPAGTPPGLCDARVMTHMGISSARAFTIGTLKEVVQKSPNTSLETAMKLETNSVCNAATTSRSIDYYTLECLQGARIVIECAAPRIDSRLAPVLIVADAQGRDLQVDRLTGRLDFIAPASDTYVIKVHGRTYQGGPEYFYRLFINNAQLGEEVPRQAGTLPVYSFSSPAPTLLVSQESEPNNAQPQAQQVSIPCEVAGRFFPAADVDAFQLTAKKSETLWIEVVSQRLALSTNPFVVVQRVVPATGTEPERLVDVAELNDIPHPIKVTTNGYSYNGPPYLPGCSDVNGKIVIPEDGVYRLQLRDLYGGTRSDPLNAYRLIIRRPTPDFSLVAWAMHMNLRNGDRHALSKPIALRPGTTMAFEVVALRRDGFEGDIDITMEGLPKGVHATGLKIASGKNMGTLLITARDDAPKTWGLAQIVGKAVIEGQSLSHEASMASMAWPVRDASREIPAPRLMTDIPVSVADADPAPLIIVPAEDKVWVGTTDQKLTVPLKLSWRGEFSGALELFILGACFEKAKAINVPLNAPTLDAVIDIQELKLEPGEYTLAFYGGVVSKYRERVDRLKLVEQADQAADQKLQERVAAAKLAAAELQAAPDEQKQAAQVSVQQTTELQQQAEKAKSQTAEKLKAAIALSNPKEIADIVVSEPIRILVQAGAAK